MILTGFQHVSSSIPNLTIDPLAGSSSTTFSNSMNQRVRICEDRFFDYTPDHLKCFGLKSIGSFVKCTKSCLYFSGGENFLEEIHLSTFLLPFRPNIYFYTAVIFVLNRQ